MDTEGSGGPVGPQPPSRIVPGLLLALLLSAFAWFFARFTAPIGVDAVALGVLLGLLVGNTLKPGQRFTPGIGFAGKRILAAAVVLLGLQVVAADLAGFAVPLLVAVGAVTSAMVLAAGIGKWWGVSPPLSMMIGAGTGICGVAAVAAVRPVVAGRDSETSYAVATVALLGSIGLIVLPIVQILWHPLHPSAFGAFSGALLHSVPQAVGAGFAGGAEAGGMVATMVKLTRVALLGPMVLVLMVAWRLLHRPTPTTGGTRIPVEVWGFLMLVVLGNLLPVPEALRTLALATSGVLLVVALVALGLSTRFGELKAAGGRPLLLAIAIWIVGATWVFFVLRSMDPWV